METILQLVGLSLFPLSAIYATYKANQTTSRLIEALAKIADKQTHRPPPPPFVTELVSNLDKLAKEGKVEVVNIKDSAPTDTPQAEAQSLIRVAKEKDCYLWHRVCAVLTDALARAKDDYKLVTTDGIFSIAFSDIIDAHIVWETARKALADKITPDPANLDTAFTFEGGTAEIVDLKND